MANTPNQNGKSRRRIAKKNSAVSSSSRAARTASRANSAAKKERNPRPAALTQPACEGAAHRSGRPVACTLRPPVKNRT